MRNDNVYTFMYAAAVCLVCSILLSLAATSLQPLQAANEKLDVRKNIMLALGMIDRQTSLSAKELNELFESRVNGVVFNNSGQLLSDVNPEEVPAESDEQHVIYQKMKEGEVAGYAFPIIGKGLWSTLKGYLALQSDANTVLGITFYSHGETPGLGAEISQPWFQENFVGKEIMNDSGDLVGVTVVKGKAEGSSKPIEHVVDGISGATITADGVTEMIQKGVNEYQPYFAGVRGS